MTEATEDVRADFVAIVREVADLPTQDVPPEAALRADLGVDSLALVEIVVATEEHFGVRIPDEDARRLVTVEDYVAYLARAAGTGQAGG